MTLARSALYGSTVVATLVTPQLVGAQDQPLLRADSTAQASATQPTRADSTRALRLSSLTLVTSETVDQLRSGQLRKGVEQGHSLLLRSPSSLTPSAPLTTAAWRRAALAPQFLFVVNSAIPFSQNYGSLWAGTGISTRTLLGFKLESPSTRIIFAPELVLSTNSNWLLRHDFYAPALPPDRSPYDFPFYVGRFTIDQPMHLGDRPIGRIDLGQTAANWRRDVNLALGAIGTNDPKQQQMEIPR